MRVENEARKKNQSLLSLCFLSTLSFIFAITWTLITFPHQNAMELLIIVLGPFEKTSANATACSLYSGSVGIKTMRRPIIIAENDTTAAILIILMLFLSPHTSMITLLMRNIPQLMMRPPSHMMMGLPNERGFMQKIFIVTVITVYVTARAMSHSKEVSFVFFPIYAP